MRRIVSLLLLAASALAADRLRFEITLDVSVTKEATAGRLFVLMADSPAPRERLRTGFEPGSTWIAAREVRSVMPGQTIELDPDVEAYPKPFSHAPEGDYQFMALLDPDHSYALTGQDADDLFSAVIAVRALAPAHAAPVRLVLSRRGKAKKPLADTAQVKLVEFQSPLLSAFWGRPIVMQAGVVLPPKYGDNSGRRYPTAYHVHGFGDNHSEAWRVGSRLVEWMREGKRMEMVHVYLNGSFPTGHHEFADSVNNGPWGRALVEELIPYLETRFRLIPTAAARFLTGHSSGGWSTLWLEVNYPDLFGGTWSTAPDPVDFRSFVGVDITPGSAQNAYRTRDGKTLNLIRRGQTELVSFEQFAHYEEVLGDYGGQLASFEWVFSPRGADGRPMQLFNRETGEQDPQVQRAWQKYDIHRVLEEQWTALAPKLRNKLHIVVGGQDTFHLEEPTGLLCQFLQSKSNENWCEIVPGRDHMNLYESYPTYPHGLEQRIDDEMRKAFEASKSN